MKTNTRSTIKVKLKQIEKSSVDYTDLYITIKNVNDIVNIGYLFIRSYLLYILEHNEKQVEPTINIDFIRSAFSVIMVNGSTKHGRPFNNNKSKTLKALNEYFEIFKSAVNFYELDSNNTSYVLGQTYEQIYISIINNIKKHYDKHLWKFIRTSFKDEHDKILELKDKDKLKEYYEELDRVKNDIYDNTFNSEEKYHSWIKSKRVLIIPATFTTSKFETDVEVNTFSYIKSMWFMNAYMQSKDGQSYQIFPLRTGCYLKHIKINTSALIEIFYGSKIFDKIEDNNLDKLNKIEYFKKAGDVKFQENVWNKIFYLKDDLGYKFGLKGYSFNYEMETDGFCVSLSFINNNEIPNKEKKKTNFKKARAETARLKKELDDDDYNKYLLNKEKKKKQKISADRLLEKQKKADAKKEFNKLSKEEQDKKKQEWNKLKEFPYIEDILKDGVNRAEFKEYYESGRLLVCDPGQRSPLYLMALNSIIHKREKNIKKNNFGISVWKNHKIMNYTNKTRLKFTKRLKYSKLIEKWKSDKPAKAQTSLKEVEKELSEHNSKSCDYKKFIEYVKKRVEYNQKIKQEYDTTYLQKLKWYGYLNREKHENELLVHIANEFGKDIIIIIGDWSNNGRMRFISTPNLRLLRKLAEWFKVYKFDEYLTSQVHYKHHIKCGNMYIKVQKKEKSDEKESTCTCETSTVKREESQKQPEFYNKKLHAVLTYQLVKLGDESNKMESGCIMRDKNSVMNAETIIKELLETGGRPAVFKRGNNRGNREDNIPDAKGANREMCNNNPNNKKRQKNQKDPSKNHKKLELIIPKKSKNRSVKNSSKNIQQSSKNKIVNNNKLIIL